MDARRPLGLPAPLTRFLGRAAELDQLAGLLPDVRLLTLVGPGGCGKTRLVVELVSRVGAGYPDRLWFVDLVPVAEDGAVATTVARALGAADAPARSRTQAAAIRVGRRRALLVLDNCEHLVGACAPLAEQLLAACPGLTLLATSREPLGVGGETVLRVGPLSVPATDAASVVLGSEAGVLFADRATFVRPGYRVSDADAGAVAAICRALDGLPLAIELAAARMRILDATAIAAGLGNCMPQLVDGPRTAAARQRTLRGSLDWSYALLSDPERTLFRRLSSFAGSFDLDAACAVGAATHLTSGQVLDVLCALVDKSLVQVVHPSAGPQDRTRFRLLETVRQYAAELLARSGEQDVVRHRHRDYYRALAECVAPAAAGAGGDSQLDLLVAELGNLRVAFRFSLTAGEPAEALRIAAALHPLWRRGRRLEGVAWLEEALTDSASAPPAQRTHALGVRCRLTNGFDPADADRVDECVRLARESGEPALLARSLIAGAGYFTRGPRAHRALLTEAAAVARDCGDDTVLLDVEAWLGLVALFGGEPGEAEQTLAAVVTRWRDRGNAHVLRACRAFAGLARVMRGEVTAALPDLRAVVAETTANGDRLMAAYAGAFLAWGAAWAARAEESAAVTADALGAEDIWGGTVHGLHVLLSVGMIELAAGDAIAAADSFARGRREAAGTPGWADQFLGPGAEAALAAGDVTEARHLADEGIARSGAEPLRWQEAWTRQARARVALIDGEAARAEQEAQQALALRREIGDIAGAADTLEFLAQLAVAAGSAERAARLLGAAQAGRDRAGCRRLAIHVQVDELIDRVHVGLGANFRQAWAAGAALSTDEAVAYASRGRGRRGRPPTGWAALTAAERDVVQLVAQGLRNKQIADRLFLSPRTVETHLTHVYAKLGVNSRVQLVGELHGMQANVLDGRL